MFVCSHHNASTLDYFAFYGPIGFQHFLAKNLYFLFCVFFAKNFEFFENFSNVSGKMESSTGPLHTIKKGINTINVSRGDVINQQNKTFKSIEDFVDYFAEDNSKKRNIKKVSQIWNV